MNERVAAYQFGQFTLDVARGCLLKESEEVKLRPKVYETLKYLVEHAGQLVGKQDLMQAVWPDAFVTDDSLVQCTVELRRALEDREQRLLKTVPRRGYLFTANVIERSATPDALATVYRAAGLGEFEPSSQKIAAKRQNLPAPRTSFVGREKQVADISALLSRQDVRLVTLTGPGGAGKTRLAVAVARAVAGQFPAGVQFVGLASIRNWDLVATAIADVLEVQQVAGRTIAQLIADQFRNSEPLLLVLDNFEQVLAAAGLVAEILEAWPAMKILVTSRSSLRIYGEHEFPVTALAQNHAAELFAQRASAVRPDFTIDADNASVIQEICSRLDGQPLAIELAAARIKVLPPKAILDRLQSSLQLLTGGALDLPERQQTLRKTIDWSHGLLNDTEAKLFRRLSVFAGGCTLEAAEAVCDTSHDLGIDVFEGLTSLVDKNLVLSTDRAEAEPRFAMLETIREYARERLVDSSEHWPVRRAHAAYCLVLAEEGNPELDPAQRARWLMQCDLEVGNFRSALDGLFDSGEVDWALRLCVALFRFWDMREHLIEGRLRLETVLALAGEAHTKERARVSQFIGAFATAQGDYPSAEHFLKESLSLYEELGDETGIAASLNALGIAARDRGDYPAAQSNLERSLACWRMLRDRLAIARCLHNLSNVVKVRGDYARAEWALREAAEIFAQMGDSVGCAWSVNQRGDIARARGDVDVARKFYQQALAAFRKAGDPWGAARSLTDLAHLDCAQGDYLRANAACREALEIFSSLGNRRGVARGIEASAALATAQGQGERALKLAGAATHLRESINVPLQQAEQASFDQTLEPAWQLVTAEEGKRAWADGSKMSLEDAIGCALADGAAVSSL